MVHINATVIGEIIPLLMDGKVYSGSNGSEKGGRDAHAYGFTEGTTEGAIWGGYSSTPGSKREMYSLRTKHGGAIGILLVLYAIQIYIELT